MITTTIGDLAKELEVDYAVAANLVKLMLAKGKGRESGKRPASGGKGKPSNLYDLELTFTVNLQKAA